MDACSLCGFVECECPNRFTQQPLRVVDYTQPDRPERKDREGLGRGFLDTIQMRLSKTCWRHYISRISAIHIMGCRRPFVGH